VRESIEQYFAAAPRSTAPAWSGQADEGIAVLESRLTGTRRLWSGLSASEWETKLGVGRFGDLTYGELVCHAVDELVHHAAEIGRMRDIFRAVRASGRL
jgi:hypothetical protein